MNGALFNVKADYTGSVANGNSALNYDIILESHNYNWSVKIKRRVNIRVVGESVPKIMVNSKILGWMDKWGLNEALYTANLKKENKIAVIKISNK